MKTEIRDITVTGDGETLQRAFQGALNKMRKELLTGRAEAILRAEPHKCSVTKATRRVWTEKFFGLFFARERHRYELVVRFSIEVSFVDLGAIDIKEESVPLTITQRLLQLK